jgi:hypothetical protein
MDTFSTSDAPPLQQWFEKQEESWFETFFANSLSDSKTAERSFVKAVNPPPSITGQYNNVQCVWPFLVNYVFPIYILSCLANIVVLFVWGAESKYHTTTYVFKMLAITDIFLTSMFITQMYVTKENFTEAADIFAVFANGHRKCNMYITLLLACVRLAKVSSEVDGRKLFSRFRLKIYFGIIAAVTIGIHAIARTTDDRCRYVCCSIM